MTPWTWRKFRTWLVTEALVNGRTFHWCKDCRYYKRGFEGWFMAPLSGDWDRCRYGAHEHSTVKVNVVRGKPIYIKTDSLPYCKDRRVAGGVCGQKAKFWEPRAKWWTRLRNLVYNTHPATEETSR